MSSAASASGAKISMFGAKSGFVIPKNKLSGSLVPVFQGGKSPGGSDSGNDQNTKQGQRKTRWGSDLTQDASVKKGRALAYQKRVDQITTQLESGSLEAENNQDSAVAPGNVVEKILDSQANGEMVEHLEVEKREAIGEILKLNPRYKAPPDYKPLTKEARLPIPVKEYPNFNFLSLILGSRGDTQKRLEKETGAKIQIFGTKTGGGEKIEISPHEGNGVQPSYEELYVKISADTYDKVDAAAAVIELLITSVSGNLGVASASASGPGDTSSVPSNSNGVAAESGAGQPTGSFSQTHHIQFQHRSPWFSAASNQTPVGPPLNSSALSFSNPIPAQQPPANSLNPPPLFGHQPSQVLQTATLPPSSQFPTPGPYAPESLSVGFSVPPRSFKPMPAPQISLVQPAFSGPLPFSGSQVEPMAPHPPLMRLSAPLAPQPGPNIAFRPRPLPDMGSGNMGQGAQPLVPNFRPQPLTRQPGIELPSISFPSSHQLNYPAPYPSGASLQPVPVSAPTLTPIALRPSGSTPIGIPSFPSRHPPTTSAPRVLHADFAFQPQQPNNIRAAPQITSRQSIHLGPPPGSAFPHRALQPPAANLASRPVTQPFPRPQHFGRQIDQPQSHMASLFPGNPRSSSPTFQNFGPPMSRMRPMNSPAAPPQFPNLSATLPPRPVFRHTAPISGGRQQNHRPFYAGGQQVYDPFSPSDA